MADEFRLRLAKEGTLKVNLTGDVVYYDMDNVHADTTANWNAQPQFVGKKGHLYIYTDYDTIDGVPIPAMKIGDGSAYLIDAPFLTANATRFNAHVADTDVHIQPGEREFWNNKVTAFISQGDEETLVVTKLSEEEFNNG